MQINMDPNEKFTDVKVSKLVECVGILPMFVSESYMKNDNPTARQMFDGMMAEYGMGFGDGTEMKVDIKPDGTWVSDYPEDPDLDPIVTITCDNVEVHLYQHALVAVVDSDTTLTTRMD